MKTNNSFSLSEINMASLSVEEEKEINGGAIPPAIAAIYEVNIFDTISYQIDSFYILDRGYIDFKRLYRIQFLLFFPPRSLSPLAETLRHAFQLLCPSMQVPTHLVDLQSTRTVFSFHSKDYAEEKTQKSLY